MVYYVVKQVLRLGKEGPVEEKPVEEKPVGGKPVEGKEKIKKILDIKNARANLSPLLCHQSLYQHTFFPTHFQITHPAKRF